LAAVFVTSGAGAVGAAPGELRVVVTDAAGDVRLDGTPEAAGVPDGHLDLLGVSLRCKASTLSVFISLAMLSDTRTGSWTVRFTAGRARLFAEFARGPADVKVGSVTGPSGFRAGVEGGKVSQVQGNYNVTASTIRIDIPLRALAPAVAAASVLTRFAVESRGTAVNVGAGANRAHVVLTDVGISGDSYALGSTC
jgi:hypothetical protein